MSEHQDAAARAMRDAREWMSHSFPGCKIFENRVQSLAAMITRHYEYGVADGQIAIIEKVDGPALDGVIRALGHDPAELLESANRSVKKAIAEYEKRKSGAAADTPSTPEE